MTKKKVLLIGPAPQNIGGISMHLRRLMALLKDDFDFDIVDEGHVRYPHVFNLRSLNLFRYYKLLWHSDIVHVNSGVFILRCFHIINSLLLGKKTIVTIHRDPRIEGHIAITKKLVSKCNHAILVNHEGYDALKTQGKCSYHLLPAFLPPVLDDEPALPSQIVDWISAFRSNHQEKSTICCSNAWNLVLHDGEDLYGLDLCLQAIADLCHRGFTSIALVFVVATNTDNQLLLDSYKDYIAREGIGDNVLIWESPISFVRLVAASNIVLRATNTDGDAISLREAIYYRKPVVASDVVDRPKGTILFKNRDSVDLASKIKATAEGNFHAAGDDMTIDFRSTYLDIYNH